MKVECGEIELNNQTTAPPTSGDNIHNITRARHQNFSITACETNLQFLMVLAVPHGVLEYHIIELSKLKTKAKFQFRCPS
jgi:hypothetical protein